MKLRLNRFIFYFSILCVAFLTEAPRVQAQSNDSEDSVESPTPQEEEEVENSFSQIPQEFPSEEAQFQWLNFRINQLTVFQGAGNSFTAEMSWNPAYHLSDRFSLSLQLGGTVFLSDKRSYFPVIELEFRGAYRISEVFRAELGGGAQAWLGVPTSYLPLVSTTIAYLFKNKILFCVDQIFIGYTAGFGVQGLASQIKLGGGISF